MKPIDIIKFEATKELYPNVVVTRGDKAFDENDNEVVVDQTAIDTKTAELQSAESNADTDKENLKASAKAKLIAGEPLTEKQVGFAIFKLAIFSGTLAIITAFMMVVSI